MKKILIILSFIFLFASFAYAANPGSIIAPNQYAKILDGDYAGTQINFKPGGVSASQAIHVYNDRIRGFAWGEATGWILFSCEDTVSGCSGVNGNFKVENNGLGFLSGYAWGQTTGWISFSCVNPTSSCVGTAGNWGVVINGNGELSGYAWSQNFGWIQFDCNTAGACVKTDWANGGITGGSSSGGSGSGSTGTTAGSTGVTTGTTTTGTTAGTTTGTTGTTGSTTGASGTGSTSGGSGSMGSTTAGTGSTTSSGSGSTGTTAGSTGVTTGTTTTGTTAGTTTGTTGTTGSTTGTSGTGSTSGGASSSGSGSGSGSSSGFFGSASSSGSFIQSLNNTISNGISNLTNGGSYPEFIDEVGEAAGDVIPIAGVVAGLMATLVSVFFAQALSFSEILFLPLRMWSSVLLLFGITKKPWGTVYDSLTKQPIDPAYVSLIDVTTGEEVASSLTDINGRYGFSDVKKGRYRIVVSKTHYKFPSNFLSGRPTDDIYEDIYHGEEFDITEDGALITKNIPIDAESVDWNEVAKREQNLMSFNPVREGRWQKVAHFIYLAGFVGAMLLVIASPTKINKWSLVFYIVSGIIMYILRIPKIRAYFSKSHALVIESHADNPVPFAVVEIKNPETNVTVAKRVTNQDGLFYALLEKGTYTVQISKPKRVGEYEKVFESSPTTVKKGFISSRFEI